MPEDSEKNANRQTEPKRLAEGTVEQLVEQVILHVHLQPLQPTPLDSERP